MTFKLVVMPNGKAILASPKDIDRETAARIQDAWREWAEGDEAKLVVIPGCEVVQVLEVELDVGEAA